MLAVINSDDKIVCFLALFLVLYEVFCFYVGSNFYFALTYFAFFLFAFFMFLFPYVNNSVVSHTSATSQTIDGSVNCDIDPTSSQQFDPMATKQVNESNKLTRKQMTIS